MNAESLLLKAKSLLAVKHPYFGMLAARLKHEPSESISSYASNGVRFIYNPAFIERCTVEEVMFVLTNCVMHHVLSHHQRRLKRRGRLWQLSTDFAINNMLVQNGMKVPKGANYNSEFKGMYAEEIYDLLKEELNLSEADAFGDEAATQDQSGMQNEGEELDLSTIGNISDALDAQTESQWEYASSIAMQSAQRKGSSPSGFDRLGKKAVASDIDWRFELYNAINRHMRNNYAFMPPNKKHIYRGFALPSLTSDTLSLCIAIDTSGSINEVLLGSFMEEFKSIMQNFPSIKIELLIADAKVHDHYTFQGGERLDFRIKGGGGTDYRPVFDYIEANLPMTSMLLYFTDGEGMFPKIPPSFEVLWALSDKAKVPFGRSVLLF